MPHQPDGDVEENSRKEDEEQQQHQHQQRSESESKSWKERRTREKSLWIMIGVLLVMFLIVLIFLIRSGAIVNTKVVKEKRTCSTPACVEEAFRLLKYGNYTTDYCSSFSEFACGFKSKINAEDGFTYTDHHLSLVKKLLDGCTDEDEVEATKAKTFYHSCMNNDWSQNTNNTVRKLLTKAGLTNSASGTDTYRREKTLALLNTYRDKNPFFRFHRIHQIIYLYPGRPVLKPNVLLIDTNSNLLTRMRYENLINSTLIELGFHPRDADKDAEELVRFEREFAEICTMRCPTKSSQLSLDRLEELYNEVKWSAIIKHIYRIYGLEDEFSQNMKVVVICEKYLMKLFHLLDKYGYRVVDNFVTWSFAVNYLPFLDPTFRYRYRNIEDAIDSHWSGNIYENSEKMCLYATLYYFNPPISILYHRKELSEHEEEEMEEIFENVQEAYEEVISEQEWLDESAKTQCKTMIKEMEMKIGFTKQFDDESNIISSMYSWVNVSNDVVENILALDKAIFAEKIARISWTLIDNPAMDIDASYTPNVLTLSFGTTLPPVYKMGIPKYLNYGTLGFIMAHKMSHAFLSSGSVKKILNKETFREKENCFDHQYSQCSGNEGETISGSIILQDYLADQFGLTVALKAYEDYIEEHEEELALPALNLTTKQIFFLNYAQMICDIGTERFILSEDEEIFDFCRIDNVLQNMAEFAETFDCSEGSNMNPVEECEIWE